MLTRRFLVCALTAFVLFTTGQIVYAVSERLSGDHGVSRAFQLWLEEWNREGEIQSHEQQLELRRAFMTQVADQVETGEMSIEEGIEAYRTQFPQGVDPLMPGETDEDRLGRCLLRFVEMNQNKRAERDELRQAELRDQLRQHVAREQARSPVPAADPVH